jgi:hypothetical protein
MQVIKSIMTARAAEQAGWSLCTECEPLFVQLTSLMPTSSPVCRLVPRKISPKDPPPSLRPSLYFPAIKMSKEHIAVVTAEGALQGPGLPRPPARVAAELKSYYIASLGCCRRVKASAGSPGRNLMVMKT